MTHSLDSWGITRSGVRSLARRLRRVLRAHGSERVGCAGLISAAKTAIPEGRAEFVHSTGSRMRMPVGGTRERGGEVSEVQDFPWGRFVFFKDPAGNGWALQALDSPCVPSSGRRR
jgi:hypothetical protein